MNPQSQALANLAKDIASTIRTDLTYQELDKLYMLIAWDWPTQQDKIHMATLLSRIDACWHYAPISIKSLPAKIPLPEPFNTRENAHFLISKLSCLKRKAERKRQLEEYLREHEEEVLVEMIRKGPENVIYADTPELVSHALITKKLRPRLVRIIEGRDEKIRINWNGREENNEEI